MAFADALDGSDVNSKGVKKKDVKQTLRSGLTVNVIGMGSALLGLQAMVGMLVCTYTLHAVSVCCHRAFTFRRTMRLRTCTTVLLHFGGALQETEVVRTVGCQDTDQRICKPFLCQHCIQLFQPSSGHRRLPRASSDKHSPVALYVPGDLLPSAACCGPVDSQREVLLDVASQRDRRGFLEPVTAHAHRESNLSRFRCSGRGLVGTASCHQYCSPGNTWSALKRGG